jgi:hypothetical protein
MGPLAQALQRKAPKEELIDAALTKHQDSFAN